MMNIGFNPTVDGKKLTVEINFFDFDDDIYGEFIQINILKRIRHEEKFDSLQTLKNQLAKDELTARGICHSN